MTRLRGAQLPKQRPKREDELLAQGRERVQRLMSEGARLLAAKRPGEALVLLARAWELDPQNADAAINLGGAFILQGKHKLAVPVLEAASRLEPDNPMVWTNLAAAYLGKLPFASPEQQDRAIAAYERVLALEPRTAHVHYNLGLIYLQRQDPSRASMHFRHALATDPDDRDARLWLERIGRGEIEAAGAAG
ncbi:MAG: tetratricopeptide repeat protein [Anaerolineae bacterium]